MKFEIKMNKSRLGLSFNFFDQNRIGIKIENNFTMFSEQNVKS